LYECPKKISVADAGDFDLDHFILCSIRWTEGILIGLAEQLGNQTAKDILEKS
jgi:hypothetical protein